MVTFAEWLLRTGWQAAVLAALVLLAQFLFGRWLSPAWRYRLWGLVVLRLMMPALPASDLSLFNLEHVGGPRLFGPKAPAAPPASGSAARVAPVDAIAAVEGAGTAGEAALEAPSVVVTAAPPRLGADASPRTSAPIPPAARPDPLLLFLAVWALGAAAMVARLAWGHVTFTRRLRSAVPLDDPAASALLRRCAAEFGVGAPPRVLVTDTVSGPALAGVLRPALLLPPGLVGRLTPDELRMVGLHELAHLRCRDVAVNWLLEALLAVHWFNPLVWIAFARCRADRELARDAMVLDRVRADAPGPDGASATEPAPDPASRYGNVLLKLLDGAAGLPQRRLAVGMVGVLETPSSLSLLPRRSRLEQRIRMISRFPGHAPGFPLVALLLVAGIGCAGLTGAKKPPAGPADAPSANAKGPATGPAAGDGKFTVTHVYDIRDLIIHIPNFSDAPRLGAQGALRAVGAVQAHPTTLPQADQWVRAESGNRLKQPDDDAPTRDLVHEIIHLLVDTVDPTSWRQAGGNLGAVRELSGQLIITQTPENQRLIQQLLEQLRETRSIHVMVEARLLTVEPGMLKTLGLEWPPEPPPAGADPGGAARGAAPAYYLTADKVNELLRAAQAGQGSRILSAPRVILFNGQRAYVLIASELPYVSGYRPVKGRDGGTTYEPEMSSATSGLVVDVSATASRDRKAATLTLRPQIGAVTGVTELPWPGRPEGSTLTVQEPQMRLSEMNTTVTVPDGGTVLLGGLEDVDGALNGDVPDGDVPDGDAPPVGPATRPANTRPGGPGRSRMIYMLVKPTIIVQREVQQKQFPKVR